MRHLIWMIGLGMLAACDQGPEPASPGTESVSSEVPWAEAEQQLRTVLAEESAQRLRRLSVSATGFSDAVDGLLEDPSPQRLETARQAWSHLYQSFNEGYVILACRGRASASQAERLERSDALPVLPGYIDSLEQWPDSGLVNDVTLQLTREALLDQQGATQAGEVSVGFQVVHFLLNGEPGAPRPAEAFKAVTELGEGEVGEIEDLPANRRRAYLDLASTLLVEDLSLLARDDAGPTVGSHCPVAALRDAVARQITLENLRDNTQVNQEYLASASRTLASEGLHGALKPWLGGEPGNALKTWLGARLPDASVSLPPLPAVKSPERVQALQELHADLVALERKLTTTSR